MANPRIALRNAMGTGIGPLGMGGYQAGVGTAQDAQQGLYAPPRVPRLGLDFSKPSTWAWVWFALAVGYLTGIYSLHGGRRGGII